MKRIRILAAMVLGIVVAGIAVHAVPRGSGQEKKTEKKREFKSEEKVEETSFPVKIGTRLEGAVLVPPLSEVTLRGQYVQLHQELSKHLSELELKRRVGDLDRELAAIKEKQRKAQNEKTAADELEKANRLLSNIVAAYPDTVAGQKARTLLQAGRPPEAKVEEKK